MRGRRSLFASVSEDDFHFSVQHFGRVHVHVAWHAQNFRRVVLRVFANCIVRAASSGDNVQTRGRRGTSRECHFAWQGQYLVQIHCVWNIILHGRRSFSDTLYFTLLSLHRHTTLYTLHSTLHIVYFTFYAVHFTLYTQHFTPHTLHSALYTVHSTTYNLHFTFYTLHSTLQSLHFTF